MRSRFALVFNARAGLAVPRRLDGVLAHVRAAGADVFQLPARSSEEATSRVNETALAGACDAVIAAGGDGTFRAVASGAAGTGLPIGLLPIGTGNVLAHELGIGQSVASIAATLLEGPVIDATSSLANGQPFFLMAGAGFDGGIVAGLNQRTKRLVGRAAYTRPVLAALHRGAEPFDVEIDGEMHQASWMIATRVSRYGGSFELTRDTHFGHGALIAILIDARTRRQLLRAALSLPLGRLVAPATRPDFVSVHSPERIVIGRSQVVPLQVDGDDAGTATLVVQRAGPAIRVIVPAHRSR